VRRRTGSLGVGVALMVAGVLGLVSCGEEGLSPGLTPPDDVLFFPHGMLLDPRVDAAAGPVCADSSECDDGYSCARGVCREPARWMFVTNANSDIRYNGGSIVAIDLNAWFTAMDGELSPAESVPDADRPCRRDSLDTDLTECAEEFFIAEEVTVHTGSFSLVPAAWDCEVELTEPADETGVRPRRIERHCAEEQARILVPVNGDPSIVWATISGGLSDRASDEPRIECGQGSQSDTRRCGEDHRLRYVRDDDSLLPLPREMTNILVSPDPRYPLAYLAHDTQGGGVPGGLTMVRLDGLRGVEEPGDPGDPVSTEAPAVTMVNDPLPPSIIDVGGLYAGSAVGGFGLAQRPCDSATAPVTTTNCSAPLVYAAYRTSESGLPRLATFTARRLRPSDLAPDQACVGPDDIGDATPVICDEVIQAESTYIIDNTFARVGEVHLDADGDTLFAVQQALTSGASAGAGPSALVRVNVPLDVFGEPILEGTNTYAEVCDGASALAIYDDGVDRMGLVSCYRSAQIFIVDLQTMSVVSTAFAGAGAHRMTVDLAREVVYVANTLDATLSVIDMSPDRSTRFRTFARLGLSEPFSQ
jgi:hypothetical protein